jgi:hypothetical protein
VGLLAVDVTAFGVVMSADSQLVEIREGAFNVDTAGGRVRDPIIVREGGGFIGLVGFVGTERIEGIETRQWLDRFSTTWPDDALKTFCERLAAQLTEVWQRDGLRSILEILVTGEIGGDLHFWYVRNSDGFRPEDGQFAAPADAFAAVDDLANYLRRDGSPGESANELLHRITYSFRQGILLPASPVFDGFAQLLQTLWTVHAQGFAPLGSLDDVGHFARMRMEFLKRLCTAKYGIYREGVATPIGGVVHVYGVDIGGRVSEYMKQRDMTKTILDERA